MKKETCIIHPPSKHGSIDQIFENIWFVKGQLKMAMRLPVYISRSMTIIRENDELTLINPIQLSESGMQILESLGKISSVIRIGGFHGRDDAFFKARYHAVITSRTAGRLIAIDNRRIARTAKLAGAPRQQLAGLRLLVQIGDHIEFGKPLFEIHAETLGELEYARSYAEAQLGLCTIEEAN